MDGSGYPVAVIVDPNYGARAADVANRCHTWIVMSPTNLAVTAARQVDAFSLESGFTTFRGGETSEQSLLSILPVVELHHGEHSHDPPVSVLEVIGTPATEAIREELNDLDFDVVESTAEGFISHRRATR